MARGRHAKPAEVKALLGNPGKRRLALADKDAPAPAPRPAVVEPPSYLTKEREIAAFKHVYASLPLNLARESDIDAVARWAVWLNRWAEAKLALDGKEGWYESESRHGKFLRDHPLAKQMHRAEAHLIALEDRLCLNITARNNVMHRLFNMPPAHPGDLFTDDQDETPEEERAADAVAPRPEELDPLGYLDKAGKQHLN